MCRPGLAPQSTPRHCHRYFAGRVRKTPAIPNGSKVFRESGAIQSVRVRTERRVRVVAVASRTGSRKHWSHASHFPTSQYPLKESRIGFVQFHRRIKVERES